MTTVVGMVGTGEMGSAVGGAYRAGGARVVACVVGRTDRSRRLAAAAGLELLDSLETVIDVADIVLSVVPPAAAQDVAASIGAAAAATTSTPLVADLNAVSPATVAGLATILRNAGLELLDGSISGPPPRPGGRTTLYLAGLRAGELAALPAPGLEPRIVGPELGLASAVKMCTASVYKGHIALLAHAALTAHAHGVLEEVLADLRSSYPELVDRANVAIARAAAKAGRYVGEMREIETTQAAAGLPRALFAGMAEVYAAFAETTRAAAAPEDVDAEIPLDQVLDELARAANAVSGEVEARGGAAAQP